jgi:ribonuclease D
LHALRDFKADGFVDLQHEAIRWGIQEKSLRKLSAIVLGERVSKAQRLSNWDAEQLTLQQQEYAATDAWVCPRILNHLMAMEPKSEPPHIISCRGVVETLNAPTKRPRKRPHRHRETSENKN